MLVWARKCFFFFVSSRTTIGGLEEVPSLRDGLGASSVYKEKREHTQTELSEIRVVARIDLGRTRRAAPRRDAPPVISRYCRFLDPPPARAIRIRCAIRHRRIDREDVRQDTPKITSSDRDVV